MSSDSCLSSQEKTNKSGNMGQRFFI